MMTEYAVFAKSNNVQAKILPRGYGIAGASGEVVGGGTKMSCDSLKRVSSLRRSRGARVRFFSVDRFFSSR